MTGDNLIPSSLRLAYDALRFSRVPAARRDRYCQCLLIHVPLCILAYSEILRICGSNGPILRLRINAFSTLSLQIPLPYSNLVLIDKDLQYLSTGAS